MSPDAMMEVAKYIGTAFGTAMLCVFGYMAKNAYRPTAKPESAPPAPSTNVSIVDCMRYRAEDRKMSEDLAKRVVMIEGKISGIEQRMDDLKEDVAKLRADMDRLRDDVQKVLVIVSSMTRGALASRDDFR